VSSRAAYSGTPLPRKIGAKPGDRALVVSAPPDAPVLFEDDVRVLRRAGGAPLDVIVVFTTARADLERRLRTLRARLQPAGMLWVAWPKRASGVATDLTEDVVRDVALPTGLVDTKVAAIDDTWSGLRLVIRRELR
jgi:Protein of unknown function (DUF3052)